jgi:hypothetical protein
VGSQTLELGTSAGLLLWQPREQAGSMWKYVPLTSVGDFSVKLCLGKWERYSRSTWVTWAHQDFGIPFFVASLSYCVPQIRVCPQASSPFGPEFHGSEHADLDLTVVYRLPCFHWLSLTTSFQCVVLANWQKRNEVTWSPRHLLI